MARQATSNHLCMPQCPPATLSQLQMRCPWEPQGHRLPTLKRMPHTSLLLFNTCRRRHTLLCKM